MRVGCRSFACGRVPADSGQFRRKWASISPWVLGFWAVSGGGCSMSAPPTWGNAGAGWRFGLIRPAKPPRSLQMGFACVEGACLTCASVPAVPVTSIAIAEPRALMPRARTGGVEVFGGVRGSEGLPSSGGSWALRCAKSRPRG